MRAQFATIAVALVVALIVGFVALDQRGQAQDERDAADAARGQAEAERDAADAARSDALDSGAGAAERDAADAARRDATARELAAAADANIDVDPERSVLLGLRGRHDKDVDGTVLPEALDALHRAVGENRVLVTVPDVGGTMDWNPTDDNFVTEGPEESGMVDIRSATTGESILSWRGDDIDINDVEYSADGTMLAVVGDGGVVKVFDPTDGSLISTVVGGGAAVSGRRSAPTGRGCSRNGPTSRRSARSIRPPVRRSLSSTPISARSRPAPTAIARSLDWAMHRMGRSTMTYRLTRWWC